MLKNTFSPYEELLAYECIMSYNKYSTADISRILKEKNFLPSQLLDSDNDFILQQTRVKIQSEFKECDFSIAVRNWIQYPEGLLDVDPPLPLFYYKGDINLLRSKCISVVGSRKATEDGLKRAKKLVLGLIQKDYTIVSGLAMGIDTVALKTAIENGGRVIAVIGTPINQYYPKENKELQDIIGNKHLLISHIPIKRYREMPFVSRRNFFPERNITMSAISSATVIVEASDTSGTLVQARAAIKQNRKLFILNSCFENKSITWPAHYEKLGAIRITDMDDIYKHLN